MLMRLRLVQRKGWLRKDLSSRRSRIVSFLIFKTHGSEKYDRYLVDVFYLKNEKSEQKILNEGIFLNNELVDESFAEPVI